MAFFVRNDLRFLSLHANAPETEQRP